MKLKLIKKRYFYSIKSKIKHQYKKILKYNIPNDLKSIVKKQSKGKQGDKFAFFVNCCTDSISRTYTIEENYPKLVGIKIILDMFDNYYSKNRIFQKRIINFSLELMGIEKNKRILFLKNLENITIPPSIKMLNISDDKKNEYSHLCYLFELLALNVGEWLNIAAYQQKNLQLIFRYYALFNVISKEKRLKSKRRLSNLYKKYPSYDLEEYRTYFLDKIKTKSMILSKDNFNFIYQAALICE